MDNRHQEQVERIHRKIMKNVKEVIMEGLGDPKYPSFIFKGRKFAGCGKIQFNVVWLAHAYREMVRMEFLDMQYKKETGRDIRRTFGP